MGRHFVFDPSCSRAVKDHRGTSAALLRVRDSMRELVEAVKFRWCDVKTVR
jgi:hypothetical protein